jgi:hypothetical protein
MLGVTTDHIVSHALPPTSQEERLLRARLCHLGTMVGCLIHEGVAAAAGIDPRDASRVGEEIGVEEFAPVVAVVGGKPVKASLVTYRGLDFVLGDDVERQPFAMVRPSGVSAPWPAPRSVEARRA